MSVPPQRRQKIAEVSEVSQGPEVIEIFDEEVNRVEDCC